MKQTFNLKKFASVLTSKSGIANRIIGLNPCPLLKGTYSLSLCRNRLFDLDDHHRNGIQQQVYETLFD